MGTKQNESEAAKKVVEMRQPEVQRIFLNKDQAQLIAGILQHQEQIKAQLTAAIVMLGVQGKVTFVGAQLNGDGELYLDLVKRKED